MTTTTTPLVGPRVIGLAHYASRAVLERALAPHGIDFLQSVTLRLTVVADGPVERAGLAAEVVDTVKVAEADAQRTIDTLAAVGLISVEEPSLVRVTAAGRELYATTSAATAPISARIYAGISEEDRAVAGRVLALITERANAELAALSTQNS
ncbi:MarR family transcriptional regulator [Streptomyces sp. NPDC020192]|uniref:MarR family transcriptional regulator n=1 Tax=Streptomyces sp. NPDC020192 TaxID=3365066 RepID=UPI0037910183